MCGDEKICKALKVICKPSKPNLSFIYGLVITFSGENASIMVIKNDKCYTIFAELTKGNLVKYIL